MAITNSADFHFKCCFFLFLKKFLFSSLVEKQDQQKHIAAAGNAPNHVLIYCPHTEATI